MDLHIDTIPNIIAERGRPRGWERLRDLLLEHYEELGDVWKVLKAVLEIDKHALYCAVAEAKGKGGMDERWEEFLGYLQGRGVNITTDEGTNGEGEKDRSETGKEGVETGVLRGAAGQRKRAPRNAKRAAREAKQEIALMPGLPDELVGAVHDS